MSNNQTVEMKLVCRELVEVLGDMLTWQWDDRFETILSQFEIDDAEKIKTLLNKFMKTTWNIENGKNAPENIQNIISNFGGFMPGQFLFTSDPEKETVIFCAWWPWGNGHTISIRISLLTEEGNTSENEDLKSLFGIIQ